MPDPANPVRHLRVVEHDENGQVIPEHCPECRRRLDEIAGLEHVIRSLSAKNSELKRKKNEEAEQHPCWDAGQWVFGYWARVTNHPRSKWSHDRFWLIEPFLSNAKWGKTLKARVARCCLAIDGVAFDAWQVARKNGTTRRFNEFDRVMGSTGQFEECQKKAPADARARWGAIIEAEARRK